ncbi:MAG: hypothetical protein LBI68_00560 [Azoarcus sp.]|jgi:hypothetical protein|nr:hypothetical protein [Azoarcus sp.]
MVEKYHKIQSSALYALHIQGHIAETRFAGERSPAGFHYPPVTPGIPALPCGAQALVIDRDLPMIAERYNKPQLGSRPFHT